MSIKITEVTGEAKVNKKPAMLGITVFLIAISFIIPQAVSAATLDLTAVSSGFINSGFFILTEQGGAGTGNIDTFVQIGGNTDITQAYNSTVNPVFDNGASPIFNHELFLSGAPLKTIDGINYREFLFDGNEEGGAKSKVSIDEIQIFLSNTPNQSVTTFTGNILDLADSSLIYRLDAGGDNWIKIDAIGSGEADMFAYIPNSLFTSGYQYVYLYSKFGENVVQGDGFEEWAVQSAGVVPEPASLSFLGLGLLGLLARHKTTGRFTNKITKRRR